MPTYEFRCPNGHEFTRFYKTMSTALSQLPCTKCSAVAERQMSAGAGFMFKGSGFYLTDYGKNAHRGTELGAKREDGGGRKEESGEKKPEATPTADATVKADSAAAKTEKPAKAESKSDAAGSASKTELSKSKSKSETTKPKSA